MARSAGERAAARQASSVGTLDEIEDALLETDGAISIIPRSRG